MHIGASTACLYPLPTEKALGALLEHGIKTVEIFLNTDSELSADFLMALRSRCDDYGARVAALHPFSSAFEGFYFFTDYPRRFADGLNLYKRFFEAAHTLGTDILVFHGPSKHIKLPFPFYVQQFDALLRAAAADGIVLAHENVCYCHSGTPDFFRMLRSQLPQAKFVLDLKQAIRAGSDPYAFLDAMGAGVCHLHISDHDTEQDCLAPGRGQMDFAKLAARLNRQNFTGTMIVELYLQNHNGVSEIAASIESITRLRGGNTI